MKTSSKARYSLRLIIDIAQNQAAGPVPLREVATRQGISAKYLEQLATLLSHAGLIKSVRGQQGGYLLARDAAVITAGDVIRSAEGDFNPVACLEESDDYCPLQGSCGTAGFWAGLRNTIDTYVDSVTIAQLAS
jgi:Rrf2 family protein